MNRQTVIDKTKTLVGSAASERGVEMVQVYVDLALEEFSRFAPPREYEQTITGDGTDEYDLASPWDDDASVVLSAHYWPSNDTDEEPTILSSSDYQVERNLPDDAATQIRFLTFSPSSSDRVVVTFTAPHILGETAALTTVPAKFALGLAYLAGSMLLDAAAAGTAATVPQASDADFVSGAFGTAGDAYRRQAQRFAQKADDMLGINREGAETGGQPQVVAKRAVPGRSRGRRYVTHGRRRWPQ